MKDIFRRGSPTGVIYRQENHRSWGNMIDWWRSPTKKRFLKPTGRMVGWLPYTLCEKDLIVTPMQGGNNAVFVVTSVEHMRDPRDMFFADVRFVGWEDDAYWSQFDLSESRGGCLP